jgi:uncharacterized protein DUF2510/uncharacterized protein DUF4333
MTVETPQPAGWYDDPNDPSAQRYWDGKDWPPQRQRKSTASSAPLPPPPPPHSASQGGPASGQQAPWDQLRPHGSRAPGLLSRLARQRWVLFAAAGLVPIVIGAVALRMVFHSGTGGHSVFHSGRRVDGSALQTDIIQRIGPGGGPDSVTCPDLPGEVGKTATCEVKWAEGIGDNDVIATVTNVDGDKVAYNLVPALTKEQLEQHIQDQNNGLGGGIGGAGGPISSISCESGLQGKEGAEAHCTFSREGRHGVTATMTTIDGLTFTIDYMPDH